VEKVGPAILREINRRKVLKLIRQNRPISRKEIVGLSKLGKNTISLIAEDLIHENVIYEAYTENKKQAGRPTIALDFQTDGMLILGIVLTAKIITGTVYNYGLSTVRHYEEPVQLKENLVDKLMNFIKNVLRDYPALFGVSIAIPGIVNSGKGVIEKSFQLKWENVNLKEMLESFFEGKVFLCNTVKSVALLQYEVALNKPESAFFMNIDKGLGGAYIRKNKALYGKNGCACEIGQMLVSISDDQNDQTVEAFYNSIIGSYECISKIKKEDIERITNMIFKLIINLNYLFDPEKIFLYGSTINHNLFKESLTAKKIPTNVSFCEQLDNNLASAYALINDFENGIEY